MGYEVTLLTSIGIAVLFALSLNIILGFCGQISLGHAAFLGIGAYTSALVARAGLPVEFALLPAMALSGAIGLVVGFASLRVRHDFLAITTMGVGFLFIGILRQQDWLGGEMGIAAIPGSGFGRIWFMFLVLLLAALVALFSLYLKSSWMGFVFESLAEDEDTSRLLGTDVARYKLAAFAIGSALAGLAGGLYAHHIRFIAPDSFGFVESITVLAMVVVGGIGSVWGVALAAALLSLSPLLFQPIEDYKLLVYGGLLFAMMRFAPDGIAGLARQAIGSLRGRAG